MRRKPFISAAVVYAVVVAAGCSRDHWFHKGFLDPTAVGRFREDTALSPIQASLSILEEPEGIQEAAEPLPDDLVVDYSERDLAPGDIINISIYELVAPGQSTEVRVRIPPNGYDAVPVLGKIKMSGMPPAALEEEIARMLREQQILQTPEVNVTVIAAQADVFYAMGQVPSPGRFEIVRPDFRLMQAVATFGGVNPALERIYVIRNGARDPDAAGLELPPGEPESAPLQNRADAGRRMPAGGPPKPAITGMDAAESLSLADFSRGRSGGLRLAQHDSTVDEMKILEGRPPESRSPAPPPAETGPSDLPIPVWDPQTEQWIIVEPDSEEARRLIGEMPPRPEGLPEESAPARAETRPWDELADAADQTRVIDIPIKELLAGDPRYNIVIRPYDVISVPPGPYGEFYLYGQVLRPGAYGVTTRRMTVKQAIAAAGGFAPLAWPQKADLVRRLSEDEEQIIQLDLDAIFAAKAPDFYIKPDDLINVGTHPVAGFMAVLRNAFRFTYGFGFVYDRNYADSDTFAAQESIKQRRSNEALARGLPF